MTIRLATTLPEDTKGMRYVKNHHFLELEDKAGNKITLCASGVLVGDCLGCKEKCLALSNQGSMRCTHCGGEVKWSWSRPQLAFIPEHESQFMGFDAALAAAKDEGS